MSLVSRVSKETAFEHATGGLAVALKARTPPFHDDQGGSENDRNGLGADLR